MRTDSFSAVATLRTREVSQGSASCSWAERIPDEATAHPTTEHRCLRWSTATGQARSRVPRVDAHATAKYIDGSMVKGDAESNIRNMNSQSAGIMRRLG